MCGCRKYPSPPHGRSLEILRGWEWGGLKSQNSMKFNWNFQRGVEFNQKTPSLGGYGYVMEQHDFPDRKVLTLIILPSVGRYAGRFPSRSLVCKVLKFVSSMPFSSTLGGFSLLRYTRRASSFF